MYICRSWGEMGQRCLLWVAQLMFWGHAGLSLRQVYQYGRSYSMSQSVTTTAILTFSLMATSLKASIAIPMILLILRRQHRYWYQEMMGTGIWRVAMVMSSFLPVMERFEFQNFYTMWKLQQDHNWCLPSVP